MLIHVVYVQGCPDVHVAVHHGCMVDGGKEGQGREEKWLLEGSCIGEGSSYVGEDLIVGMGSYVGIGRRGI